MRVKKLFIKFELNLHNSKFDAITAMAPLQGVAKLVQIYFFVLCEETREEQEEDISRLQKFKEWAKESMVGLSAVAISIAGIITTIIIGARKAIAQGAQATSKFAKALYNLGKKLGPLLAPLLNILAQALSLGAKGLAFLANNLWILAIAVTLFLYNRYEK